MVTVVSGVHWSWPPAAAFGGGVFSGFLGVTQRHASEAVLHKKDAEVCLV